MSYPPVVVIDESTKDPVGLLRGALGPGNENDEQTVELRVDLDLTGEETINIGDNSPPPPPPRKRRRSLIASESCKRSARALGPRVYVCDERGRAALFVIRGDNVVVSGFRLEGPTADIGMGDRHEKGIVVSPTATDPEGNPLPPIQNIEICNMEIFHWSGVGVQVADNPRPRDHRSSNRGRLLNTNPTAVRVKGNYFHHNRHGPGEGYGVSSSAGAYVMIEQNVFDENRHAIAGGSKHPDFEDYSGYTARDNLILAEGGVHCLETTASAGIGGLVGGLFGGVVGFLIGGPVGAAIGAAVGAAVGAGAAAIAGICWHTHQIDMHGTKGTLRYGEHCCGTAGETIIIERNTILYTKGKAIKIRGNPVDKAVVDGNVFKHKSTGDWKGQNGDPGLTNIPTNPIYVGPNNVFNCGDLTTELGHGDFADDIECGDFADGIDRGDITPEVGDRDFADDFDRGDITPELGDRDFAGDPPGQQDDFMATGVTWWARSRTTGQWRYLNTMKERLPELQLGKFDDDDICDVAPRTRRPELPPEKYSKSGTSPWLSRNVIHP